MRCGQDRSQPDCRVELHGLPTVMDGAPMVVGAAVGAEVPDGLPCERPATKPAAAPPPAAARIAIHLACPWLREARRTGVDPADVTALSCPPIYCDETMPARACSLEA